MGNQDYAELYNSLKEDFNLLENMEPSKKQRVMKTFLDSTTGGVVIETPVQGFDGIGILFGYLPGRPGYQLYMKQDHWKYTTTDERVRKIREKSKLNSIGYVILPIEKKEFRIYPYFPKEKGECEKYIEQLRKEVLEN